MLKSSKPYLVPGIGFLIGVALEVSPLQSTFVSAFIFGIAATWLVFTVLDSAGIVSRWPALIGWMPFLEQHDHSGRNAVAQPIQRDAQLENELRRSQDAVRDLEQRLSRAEAKPPESTAAHNEPIGGSRLDIARKLLLDQAKYGRDPSTKSELRTWMTGAKDLVKGIVSHKCPNEFRAGFPHGDSPLNEQDEMTRQKAIASLRIMATNLREEHLK